MYGACPCISLLSSRVCPSRNSFVLPIISLGVISTCESMYEKLLVTESLSVIKLSDFLTSSSAPKTSALNAFLGVKLVGVSGLYTTISIGLLKCL